jgi:hypothetical protein
MRLTLAAPLLVAFLASSAVTGCSAIEEAVADQGAAAMDCDILADDAVRISNEQESMVELLKVRSPTVVTDNTDSYTLPTGTGESLILKCEGMGVWSDGSNDKVRLKATIDADGETWVSYQAINN